MMLVAGIVERQAEFVFGAATISTRAGFRAFHRTRESSARSGSKPGRHAGADATFRSANQVGNLRARARRCSVCCGGEGRSAAPNDDRSGAKEGFASNCAQIGQTGGGDSITSGGSVWESNAVPIVVSSTYEKLRGAQRKHKEPLETVIAA